MTTGIVVTPLQKLMLEFIPNILLKSTGLAALNHQILIITCNI